MRNMVRGEGRYNRQLDGRYYDQNYYMDKFTRSAFGERNRPRRTKRVDQEEDCDSDEFSTLVIGCSSIDTMEFRSDCPVPDFITCKYSERERARLTDGACLALTAFCTTRLLDQSLRKSRTLKIITNAHLA